MTDSPALTDTFLDQFQDAPASIISSMTIDESIEAIQSLHPDEWRDYEHHHPTDYSAGIVETRGLYDLVITAWGTMARTVAEINWGDDQDDPT